jgi:calcium-translocating P-type ATPase
MDSAEGELATHLPTDVTGRAPRPFAPTIAGLDRLLERGPRHAQLGIDSAPSPGPLDLLLRDLGTGVDGLEPREAARRLIVHGANSLPRLRGRSWAVDLAREFVHPIALPLWAAAGLALLAGQPVPCWALLGVIVVNAVAAFALERQRAGTVDALASCLPSEARVVRAGSTLPVSAADVVPGDVLHLAAGDRVCADARLISGTVDVDMSALTGEPAPVQRTVGDDGATGRLLAARDTVFAGATCVAGEARGVVFATGGHTELGRIAALSRRIGTELSPVGRQLRRVAWVLACVAVTIGVLSVAVGLLTGLPRTDAAVAAAGVLVATVPGGLLLASALALTVVVRSLARHGAVVKRLSAMETLGATTAICTAMTGALTENRMRVVRLWTPDGTSEPAVNSPTLRRLAETMADTNDVEPSSDSIDAALRACAGELGTQPASRVATFGFDPRRNRMSVIVRRDQHLVIQVKGTPDSVLPLCTQHRIHGLVEPMTEAAHNVVVAAVDGFAALGLQVVAMASREADFAAPRGVSDAESELCLLGLVALDDPPRPEVAGAVAACHRAGIPVHVITGDSGRTATEIARRVDIRVRRVVVGADLDAMSDATLDALLSEPGEIVFARNTPEGKLRVTDALRDLGQVVTVTGSSVHDAPALRRADVGAAMGRAGSAAARESATMVLTDDNFATMVRAVHAGRRAYANLRRVVLYTVAAAVPQVAPFAVFAFSAGTVPLPLTLPQLLVVELAIATLPAIALGLEAAEPDAMDRAPRARREPLITRRALGRAGLLGASSAALALGMFFAVLSRAGWHPGDGVGSGSSLHHAYLEASTITLAAVVACQIGTAFAARTDRVALSTVGVFSNRLLLLGIAVEVVLVAVVIFVPALRSVFGTAAPPAWAMALLALCPVIVWGVDEIYRFAARRRSSDPDGKGPQSLNNRTIAGGYVPAKTAG